MNEEVRTHGPSDIEARYRLLAENMSEVVCQIGPQGEILFISPSVRPVLGYTPSAVEGRDIYEFLHPEDRPRAEADYRRFSATGTIEQLNYRVQHANGHYVWMVVRARPVLDRQFLPEGMVVSAQDISDRQALSAELEAQRQEADQKLERQLEELRKIIEQLRNEIEARKDADREQAEQWKRQEAIMRVMPVVLYSAQLGTPFAAVWMSENVSFVTGFPLEKFLQEPNFWKDRVHPDDRETVEEYLKNVSAGKIEQTEYRWQCADGEYHWFLDQVVNVQLSDGSIMEYFGIWIDITSRQDIKRKVNKIKH